MQRERACTVMWVLPLSSGEIRLWSCLHNCFRSCLAEGPICSLVSETLKAIPVFGHGVTRYISLPTKNFLHLEGTVGR